MKKNNCSEAGSFNPRIFAAFLLCSAAAWLTLLAYASTPSSGTLTDVSAPVTYSAGPFTQPNPSPLGAGQLDTGPRCDSSTFPCDTFSLTVTLPAGYGAAHPSAAIKVSAGWVDTGTGKADYDLYIYKLPRNDCASTTGTPSPDCSQTDGAESANYQSASSSNPEVATISPQDGTTVYTIHIVPYTPTGETVNVTAQLFPGATGGGGGGGGGSVPFGSMDPTVANAPRFLNFYAPEGTSAQAASGEFNIGYNANTKRIMVMNIGPVWRLTLPEYFSPAKPECCEALWQDESPVLTTTGLDPILWTDQLTGRTMATNVTTGATVLYAYTTNDGDDGWTQPAAGLPNGGADHETIGTGPYPASLSSLATALNQGHAAYYCSQDVVGPAACYRSDTLGTAWGSAITLPYQGQHLPGDPCGGLHGHIHVAPDGAIWLPVNQCTGQQGGSFSTDGGTTWTEFQVPNNLAGATPTGVSQSNGADPSIAIDANSRVYYAYVNNQANGNEGHARVATGTLTGCTVNPITNIRSGCTISWGPDIDIGTSHGIVNAAEIEATQGGDANRAAVGFLGTNRTGDYQSGSFPGDWYAFIATTYDGGQTWTTVNASPNDPVQHATGVWQQGGSGQNGDRNLLDFTEITIGDKGQVLYGYSDGCTSSGCINKTAGNDYVAFMRVARQSGGKGMYAANDVPEPTTPKAPCLSGTRDITGSDLTWRIPDNGGADIIAYQIYRSTTSGTEGLIATYNVNNSSKPEYFDATANPNVPTYYYKIRAVNSVGVGVNLSNEIVLSVVAPVVQSPCQLPGVTVLTDAVGDSTNPATGTDLISASVAQPYSSKNGQKLDFTIATVPEPTAASSKIAGSAWYLAMKLVNGTTTTYTGVRMEGGPTGPTFYYYTPGGNTSGTVDGRFVSSKTATPGTYDPNTGLITITVDASNLGLATGSVIQGFVAGSTQTTDPTEMVAGATEVWDSMPDSLSFTNTYTVQANNACAPLQSVVSRKVHGSAGTFDINLPLTGTPGEETRGTGLTNNSYTLIYTLGGVVSTPGSASASQGSATTSAGPGSNQVTVNLTGVNSAQHLSVNLTNVGIVNGGTLTNLTVPMDVLVGDVNASGRVDNGDATAVRNNSGTAPTSTNFRPDVNASGRVDNGDATIVRNVSGSALP